jgi:hypothetical protein
MSNFDQNLVIADALRTSFNSIKKQVVEESFWGDEAILEKVAKAQKEYKLFQEITEKLKAEDYDRYTTEFLGL